MLAKVYPDLGQKPFASTRLCWYVYSALGLTGVQVDTPTGTPTPLTEHGT
jgi:hypothetical protein